MKINSTDSTNDLLAERILTGPQSVSKSIIPIFGIGKKGEPDFYGTSVYLSLRSHHFLISAAHVFDALEHQRQQPHIFIDKEFQNINGDLMISPLLEEQDYNYKNNIDFAIFELTIDFASAVFRNYSPLTREHLAVNQKPHPYYLTFGYPGGQVKTNTLARSVKTVLRGFVLEHASEQDYSSQGINTATHIAYRYPKKRTDGKKNPKPQGISGGGIFYFPDLHNNLEFSSRSLLVGINIHSHPCSQGQYRINSGIKIDIITEILRRQIPDLLDFLPPSEIRMNIR